MPGVGLGLERKEGGQIPRKLSELELDYWSGRVAFAPLTPAWCWRLFAPRPCFPLVAFPGLAGGLGWPGEEARPLRHPCSSSSCLHHLLTPGGPLPLGPRLLTGFKASLAAPLCGSVAHIFRPAGTRAPCPLVLLLSPWWDSPLFPSP